MNDTNKAEEAAPTQKNEDATSKEQIYVLIGDHVKEKTGKRIGKTGGREIFDLVVAQIFAAAAKDGTFRFNGGFGSLHVKDYQAGSRRLPSGETTTFGERSKLRYEEGVVTKALVANNGDLEAVMRERGQEAGETKAADETKPAAETTAAPAAAVSTETANAAPAADADAGVDLD